VSTIKLTVNGKAVSAEVEDRTLLVQLLRENLNLTGTHVGCDTSQCGACVVHIDGRAVKSCTVLVGQANGANVTTIEGISKGDELHPMQAAFRDNHGLQCGYCTPGMIMSAIDIVHRHSGGLDEETVRHELEGNICRCTGYHNIVKSVLDAAGRMKVSPAFDSIIRFRPPNFDGNGGQQNSGREIRTWALKVLARASCARKTDDSSQAAAATSTTSSCRA
jgi:carbon-monoxide dehydrogenase small subunit